MKRNQEEDGDRSDEKEVEEGGGGGRGEGKRTSRALGAILGVEVMVQRHSM